MERSLLWSAFALGWFSWLYGLLATRSQRTGSVSGEMGISRPFLRTALGLPILVFLITLPSRPPFAAGHGLGNGFLLGGIGALLSGWVLLRALHSEKTAASALLPSRAAIAIAAPYGMALVTAITPLLWMRAALPDALLSVAIGWFCISVLLYVGALSPLTPQPPLPQGARGRASSGARPLPGIGGGGWGLSLVVGTAFAVLLCTVAALGEYRGAVAIAGSAQVVSWSALGMVFAAGVPLVLLLTALPASLLGQIVLKLPLASLFAGLSGRMVQTEDARRTAVRGLRFLFCLLLLLGLGGLLARKVSGQPHLFHVLALGIVIGLIAWWVTAARGSQEGGSAEAISRQNGALGVLVVLAGSMAAYQMLAGLGIGLMLIGVSLVAGFALTGAFERADDVNAATSPTVNDTGAEQALQTAAHLVRLLVFGLILLLYRLFATRFSGDLRGVSLSDHYAVFGFLVGALLPGLLSGFLLRPNAGSPSSQIFRLVVAAALALLVPALILVVWGAKCVLALLIGLSLAVALTETAPDTPLSAGSATDSSESIRTEWRLDPLAVSLLPCLFALAVALALTQWTHHVLPFALLSRQEKIHALLWVAGSIVALALLADYGGRWGDWRRARLGKVTPGSREGAVK